ncbi:MAG: GntR family transcriptional regulator [Oscillospiraceae bacterium]
MHNKIIEATPLREQVAGIIRRMIVSGELKAGDAISERQISQALGVSTTPVKEAFRVLESEGLLYSVPRKGSFVSELSKKNMLQIVFMRSSLEGVAAYFASKNVTDEEVVSMENALKMAGQFIEKNELSSEIAEYNELFHSTLRSASKNEYLVGLIRNMKSVDDTIRKVAATTYEVEPPRAQKEHMEILKAVKAHDAERAEQLMVSHIRRVGLFVLDHN